MGASLGSNQSMNFGIGNKSSGRQGVSGNSNNLQQMVMGQNQENDYGDSIGHTSIGLQRQVTAIDEMVE